MSAAAHLASPTHLGKLRWKCRRGMKELDELLVHYVERRFDSAPPEEQKAFQRLLDSEDSVLHAYCIGQLPPPADLAEIVTRLVARAEFHIL